MSNSRVMKIMKDMGYGVRPRPVVNPYASHAAAEILHREGKYEDAKAVRAEVDPTNEQFAMDPLDFWLEVEALGEPPRD